MRGASVGVARRPSRHARRHRQASRGPGGAVRGAALSRRLKKDPIYSIAEGAATIQKKIRHTAVKRICTRGAHPYRTDSPYSYLYEAHWPLSIEPTPSRPLSRALFPRSALEKPSESSTPLAWPTPPPRTGRPPLIKRVAGQAAARACLAAAAGQPRLDHLRAT